MGTVLKGIADISGIDYDIASGGYRCAFTPDGAEIEGVKGLVSFDGAVIVIRLKKCLIEIGGAAFKIKRYGRGYISLSGKVSQITVKQG